MATDVKNDANLSTNLISYWELEEASGSRVDSHASNTLSDINTVLQGTGIQGNCGDFEFSNGEYLTITDGAQSGLDITGDFSVSMWLNAESTPISGNYNGIIGKGIQTGNQRAYGMVLQNNSGTLRFLIGISSDGTSGAQDVLSVNYAMSTATWYHVVWTHDISASTSEIFVNGSSQGTSVGSQTAIKNSTGNFYIGDDRNFSASSVTWDGLIDEVGIWSKILSGTEITDLYNSGSGIPYEAGAGGGSANNAMFAFGGM